MVAKVGTEIVKAIGKGAANAFKNLDDIGIADKYSVKQLQKFFNSLKGIKESGVGTIRKKIKDAREFSKGREEAANPPQFKKGGKISKVTKRPMGGKVYKVDNSGQDLVQKMYGGKIKK